jgi:hypothetical protein
MDHIFPDDMVPFDIDDWTADRLLDGRVVPLDAPPGFSSVAHLIQAAKAPASAAELARQTETVAAGLTALRAVPIVIVPNAQRRGLFGRVSARREQSIHRQLSLLVRPEPKKLVAGLAVGLIFVVTAAAAAIATLPAPSSAHRGSSIAAPATSAPGGRGPGAASTGHSGRRNPSDNSLAAPDFGALPAAAAAPAGSGLTGPSVATVQLIGTSRPTGTPAGKPVAGQHSGPATVVAIPPVSPGTPPSAPLGGLGGSTGGPGVGPGPATGSGPAGCKGNGAGNPPQCRLGGPAGAIGTAPGAPQAAPTAPGNGHSNGGGQTTNGDTGGQNAGQAPTPAGQPDSSALAADIVTAAGAGRGSSASSDETSSAESAWGEDAASHTQDSGESDPGAARS